MAISRMQEPQQIQSGIGSLQDPRQGYFLGKLVKKAGRAVKKITKSPFGKAALLGLGGYALGGGFTGGFGSNKLGAFLKGGFGNFMEGNKGTIGGGLSNLFRTKDALGNYKGFNTGKLLLGGLGATALAAPFLMGGDDEEEVTEVMDPRYQVQRAKNYYSGAGDAGAGLDFMPKKEYVMQNFYAADGGRAGYANGMLVEDEEEFIRSGAGMSRRQQPTFLNMGGGAGEAQAEQMLMMEYVKYKNKGGNLSFEQFVKAVLQSQQAPEGAGMEQPQAVAMAADGGLMTQVPGYGKEPGTNQFDYPSGGEEVRTGYAGGQLVGPSGDGSRPGYAGESDIGILDVIKSFPSAVGQIFSGKTENMLGDNQEEKNKFMVQDMFPDMDEETLSMIVDMNNKGAGVDEISTITGQDPETITSMLSILTMKAYGGRIGKQEGGIMETEVAEETMPMLDMGGKEKDYRETGGFVEMGRKERADDVPARLSKNEFVFTADAVRNAGGGDIDKGAEVMENLMNNLEQGGEISEESQGLEGAQAMYDQQQMLQSRIV